MIHMFQASAHILWVQDMTYCTVFQLRIYANQIKYNERKYRTHSTVYLDILPTSTSQ